jgi:hypothetical protein
VLDVVIGHVAVAAVRLNRLKRDLCPRPGNCTASSRRLRRRWNLDRPRAVRDPNTRFCTLRRAASISASLA